MKPLEELIRREWEAAGRLSFERFMELALYHPEFGYYEQAGREVGRAGDFYTSVSVGPLFGRLLAGQFANWLLGRFDSGALVQIVEAGAHDGRLAADILVALRDRFPHLADRLEYWILEPSATRKERQAGQLKEFTGQVRWFAGWEELALEGVNGVVFANELLDAMPVQRLGWDAKEKRWFEWGVTTRDGRFIWSRLPDDGRFAVQSEELAVASEAFHRRLPRWRAPAELLAVLPDRFTLEICPAAQAWWRSAAQALRAGWLMTIDYGLIAEEWFATHRAGGTLRGYCRHHPADDVLANVGGQDLTAHVDFSALETIGEAAGLRTEELSSQARFLTRAAELEAQAAPGAWALNPAEIRQFQTLTHPDHLGRAFRVLVQSR